MTRPQPCGPGK